MRDNAAKQCAQCGLMLPIEEFGPSKQNKCGLKSYCRPCIRINAGIYRDTNKNMILERQRTFYHAGNKYTETRRAWATNNKDVTRVRYRNRRRINNANFRATPQGAMRHRLESSIRMALKRCGTRKAIKTEQLIGCSIKALKEHIESLFLLGMPWGNRASWEIDHIRPCASFDLTDENQQRECFHYSNLRPLWTADNRSKSSKWTPPEGLQLTVAA